jgi:hypothetical protein
VRLQQTEGRPIFRLSIQLKGQAGDRGGALEGCPGLFDASHVRASSGR